MKKVPSGPSIGFLNCPAQGFAGNSSGVSRRAAWRRNISPHIEAWPIVTNVICGWWSTTGHPRSREHVPRTSNHSEGVIAGLVPAIWAVELLSKELPIAICPMDDSEGNAYGDTVF